MEPRSTLGLELQSGREPSCRATHFTSDLQQAKARSEASATEVAGRVCQSSTAWPHLTNTGTISDLIMRNLGRK